MRIMLYNKTEGSKKMKEELDNLYSRKVIDPLERLLIELQVGHQLSPEEVKKLDQLLLEKYVILEKEMQKKYYNTNNNK